MAKKPRQNSQQELSSMADWHYIFSLRGGEIMIYAAAAISIFNIFNCMGMCSKLNIIVSY